MSKLVRINNDFSRRCFFKKNELNFIVFKYCRRELSNKNPDELLFKFYLHYKFICRFKLNMSLTRIRNFCIKTGRTR